MTNNAQDITKVQNTWDVGFDANAPLVAQYFSEMRTNAYISDTGIAKVLEIYAAVRLNEEDDNSWTVMKYMFLDLDGANPVFKSRPQIIKSGTKEEPETMNLGAALAEMGAIEQSMTSLPHYAAADLNKTHPEGKSVVIDKYFHNMTYYKDAANIEGVAFDEFNKPYRRVRNTVVASATFRLKDIEDSLTAVDRAAAGELKVKQSIESGILADIFNTASERARTMDSLIITAKRIAAFDKFATLAGSLYLTVQKVVGANDGFSKIGGFANDKERQTMLEKAKENVARNLTDAAEDIIPQMQAELQKAKSIGGHTEPFEKFTAESELYLYLLEASRNRKELERAILSPDYDSDLISKVTDGASKAQDVFYSIGGTEEEVDRLKSWAMSDTKSDIVPWLPGMLDTYYKVRAEKVAAISGKKPNAARNVATMAAEIKPPVGNSVKVKAKKGTTFN